MTVSSVLGTYRTVYPRARSMAVTASPSPNPPVLSSTRSASSLMDE